MQHQQDKAARNKMKQTPEPETCTPRMTREEARTDPKLNQQGPVTSAAGDLMEASEVLRRDPEVTVVEEGNLKAMDQTKIPNQIIGSKNGELAGQ